MGELDQLIERNIISDILSTLTGDVPRDKLFQSYSSNINTLVFYFPYPIAGIQVYLLILTS